VTFVVSKSVSISSRARSIAAARSVSIAAPSGSHGPRHASRVASDGERVGVEAFRAGRLDQLAHLVVPVELAVEALAKVAQLVGEHGIDDRGDRPLLLELRRALVEDAQRRRQPELEREVRHQRATHRVHRTDARREQLVRLAPAATREPPRAGPLDERGRRGRRERRRDDAIGPHVPARERLVEDLAQERRLARARARRHQPDHAQPSAPHSTA
jgi:hypothetical protein